MDNFTCPICEADRPDEHHADWCTYDGPDFDAFDDPTDEDCD